jgi:hypothetical protein
MFIFAKKLYAKHFVELKTMSQTDLIDFIKKILREDTVSEFDQFGVIEEFIANICIIESVELCLN